MAVNLGIDFTAGQSRRVQDRNSKRAARLVTLKRKTARLQRIRPVAGKRTPTIFCAGPLPEAVYGAAVNGLSDAEVLTLRRCAAQAYTPRARGRSLSRLLLIEGVPTWRANVEVVLEYSRQVWAASLQGAAVADDGTLTLAQISRIWHAEGTETIRPGDGQRRVWAEVKGPMRGSLAITASHRVDDARAVHPARPQRGGPDFDDDDPSAVGNAPETGGDEEPPGPGRREALRNGPQLPRKESGGRAHCIATTR